MISNIALRIMKMTQLKVAKSLPCVDEKSPPEDAFDEHGYPTSFEEDKSMCQKYIGQLMWLTTRTRPDIAAVLGNSSISDGGQANIHQGMPDSLVEVCVGKQLISTCIHLNQPQCSMVL